MPYLSQKLSDKKHVIGSDAATGLKAARKKLNLHQAVAKHSLSQYTPVVLLPKRHLPKAALQAMRSAASVKTDVREKRSSLQLVGGDQKCENLAGHSKNQMRRQMENVLLALAAYRKARTPISSIQ